jgi:hypothetical protein
VTDYPYPFWRRGVFAAILILVIALALVPPFAKGTVNVRFFTISTPAPILHFYITVNQLELHTAGLPSNIGWVTISWTDNFPKLDLAGQNGQSSSGALVTSPIQSGRYDQVRISIAQSSLMFNGVDTARVICSSCLSQILANATVPIAPSGYGNVLLVVSPDYESLLNTPPFLALSVVQVSTP